MARRKHPDDDQLLQLGDALRKLGCSPVAFLHRAVIGERATRPFSDGQRPAKVSPKTIAEGGSYVVYSPTVLHRIFRLRDSLVCSGGVPDYGPNDLAGLPMRKQPHIKLLPVPSKAEEALARKRLRYIVAALTGDVENASRVRFRQVMAAMVRHAEIRAELARGAASVEAARAKVAKDHRVTPAALRRQIDRAKKHAREMGVKGAFPAISGQGRRAK